MSAVRVGEEVALPEGLNVASVSSTCRRGGCLKVPSISSTCRRGGWLKVVRWPVSAVLVGEEVALWS